MNRLYTIGRIFFGISIAAMGILTIYYREFPYMMIPPKHAWLTEHAAVLIGFGLLLMLGGAGIALGRKLQPLSIGLGVLLLAIFCFYFIPFQLADLPHYHHFGNWENSAKELALAGGAFVVAGRRWLSRFGTIVFAITIISFSIDHFLYAKEASGYMPDWIPNHVFWLYFTGSALLAAGTAILLNTWRRLAATLLGAMILCWVVIIHIPKATAAPLAHNAGEVVSAFLALAYCGTAFAIAGSAKNSR